MGFTRHHVRLYCEAALIVLLAYVGGKLFLTHISAVRTETQVAALIQIKADALAGGTPKSLVSGLRNASLLSPRVQGPSRVNHLEAVVETVRQDVLSALISELRAATGKDYGNNPEAWLEAFAARTNNVQHEK